MVFGIAGFIHSDKGRSLISKELRSHLMSLGIGCSNTTPFNPQGNGQCERYNGVIWKGVQLALKSKQLDDSCWELVLPEVLHSQRSLLCTATNSTPHDRMFNYSRKSVMGTSLPTWLLNNGPVLLRRNVRKSKYDPYCDEVELVEAGPTYASVKLKDGTIKNVSLRHLAPLPADNSTSGEVYNTHENPVSEPAVVSQDKVPVPTVDEQSVSSESEGNSPVPTSNGPVPSNVMEVNISQLPTETEVRKSTRERKQTQFYQAGMG